MGTVTNITNETSPPGEDLAVALLDFQVVKAGDTVEVHDDLLHDHDEACGAELPNTSTRENCDKHGFVWPDVNWRTELSPDGQAAEEARKAAYAEQQAQPSGSEQATPPPQSSPPPTPPDETSTDSTAVDEIQE